MAIKKLNGDDCHRLLKSEAERRLAFDEGADYTAWRGQVREKLFELLGMAHIEQNTCPLNVDVEEDLALEGYRRIRFTFDSERGCTVPCYLLLPDTGLEKYPVAICLQGHSTGFHNSIGVVKYPRDEEFLGVETFGLQAVENGFAALCIEQRGMGEQRSPLYPGPGGVHACAVTAMTALNLGRTIIGERVWDVHRSIDALAEFAGLGLDLEKIMLTGISGGGTATFYAACYDERIAYCAPACAFCSYEASIMESHHCCCNFIPSACQWFEMEDLACLIAPRKLSVFTGRLDPEFPLYGVEKSSATVEKIYAAAGVPENYRMVVMPRAHYWCKDVVWPVIQEVRKELEW